VKHGMSSLYIRSYV